MKVPVDPCARQQPAAPPDSASVVPVLGRMILELRERFGERLISLEKVRPDEVYCEAGKDLVPGICAQVYKRWQGRLVSVFGDDVRRETGAFHVYYVFAIDEAHAFLVLRAPASAQAPQITSLANALPAVNWQEREIQDLFGIKLEGHPNPRRCALHDDWPEVFPLRKDFDLRTVLPAFQGERHKFRKVEGEGVFQVPVGPVHAGIIEPGHFLFSVAGEPVLYLQIRLFYTHKGTEKLFENIPVAHGVCLAESISGDSGFAHSTAFCHAVERGAGVEAPLRARCLRTVCLELERLYNHTADIGAIATDVAFVVGNAHATRLREDILRLNEQLTGNRLLRGMNRLGGVARDWSNAQTKAIEGFARKFEPEFETLVQMIAGSSSTRDRLETTGILSSAAARDLGIVGIAGRASGFTRDLRRDFPHAAYDLTQFRVPVYQGGDVFCRLQVRIDEARESLSIIRQVLAKLCDGPVRVNVPALSPGAVALGFAEGWRGEIFHWIRGGENGRLARCKVKDPSLQNWPALSEAILGNIIPDFPVVNKSFNLSYSGTDR